MTPDASDGWREERRIVTAVFVDLAGSTALVESMDPEDARDLLGGAVRLVVEHVEALGGTVKDLAGDGVLALFGAPIAHEDDAERAVLCGLRVVIAVRRHGEAARGGQDLAARVGIDTGVAVLGPVGGGHRVEYGAVGDVVNTAARLQGQADVGTVLVSESTRTMVVDRFVWGETRSLRLKGKADPVGAVVARSYRGVPGAAGDVGAPLVGRDEELSRLSRVLTGLAAGVGGVAVVLGEPGVGKSRLVNGARSHAAAAGLTWLPAACHSYASELPLLPFRHLVLDLLGRSPEDELAAARAAAPGRVPPDLLVPVADALSAAHRSGTDDPMTVQREAFSAVRDSLAGLAGLMPSVLVVEDVHWADASSVALLESVVPLTADQPLLLILTARPESGPLALTDRLSALAPLRMHRIDLAALPAGQDRRLLRELLAGATLPRRLEQELLRTTAGNPLFLEEQVRGLVAGGALVRDGATWRFAGGRRVEVAPTVERAVIARVDLLAEPAREVLLAASVLGTAFDRSLLQDVAGHSADGAVAGLVAAGMLLDGHDGIQGRLAFRHALVREAVHRSLVRGRRAELNARAAAALAAAYRGREDEVAARLGRHLAAAGEPGRAVPLLLSAARGAAATYANEEAAALAGEALDLVEGAAVDGDRSSLRELHVVRGGALRHLSRYDDAVVALRAALTFVDQPIDIARLQVDIAGALIDGHHFDAALTELVVAERALEDLVRAPDGFPCWLDIQLRRGEIHYWRGEHDAHLALLERARPVVEQLADADQRVDFYESQRTAAWRRTRYSGSPEVLELDGLIYSHRRRDPDPRVRAWAEFSHGFTLLWCGRLDDALPPLRRTADEASRLEDVQLRSRAITYLLVRERLRGEVDDAAALVDDVEAAAWEAGLPEYRAIAAATRAWIAYRRADQQECERWAGSALATWDEAAARYPFDWMACLPLLGTALTRDTARGETAEDDVRVAVECARRMMDETQQPLPAEVATALRTALGEARAPGGPRAAAPALRVALDSARRSGRV